MPLKRMQTAQSSSPMPDWRSKQLHNAGTSMSGSSRSRLQCTAAADNHNDSSAGDIHSNLETIDPDHDFGPPPFSSAASYSGDDMPIDENEHDEHRNNDMDYRARSATITESRTGTPSLHLPLHRERSQTIRPQPERFRNASTTFSSRYPPNNNNNAPSTTQDDDGDEGRTEVDLTNKARLGFLCSE